MKHRVGFNKLGLKTSHRKALHRNMSISLFRYERITTTKSKALAVKRTVERMITKAKVDSVHNRRQIARDIIDKEILVKLFTDIAPRNEKRTGGYTRILKIGTRQGDSANMVIFELVEKMGDSFYEGKSSKKSKEKKVSEKNSEVSKSKSLASDVKGVKAIVEKPDTVESLKENSISEEKN